MAAARLEGSGVWKVGDSFDVCSLPRSAGELRATISRLAALDVADFRRHAPRGAAGSLADLAGDDEFDERFDCRGRFRTVGQLPWPVGAALSPGAPGGACHAVPGGADRA